MGALRTTIIAAVFAGFAANAAEAASCDGWYDIEATQLDGAPPAAPVGWKLGDYAASPDCKGVSEEHCRAKATAMLFLCFHAHYEERDAGRRPDRCGKIDGYAIEDIRASVEQTVCCSKKARAHDAVTVALFGRVDGPSSCSLWRRGVRNFPRSEPRSEVVAPEHAIDCAEARARLCPKYAVR